jgi:truncated hemoglobin YjbI
MSIYDSIGGAPAVRAAVDDFYARVLADPRLAPFFAGTDLHRLKAHQRACLAAAIGGPQVFGGRDMAAAHAGLGIGDGDFDAVVAHLAGTLTGLGVPGDTIGQIAGTLAPLRGDIVTTSPAGPAVAADPGPPVAAEVALLEDDLAFSAVIEPSEIIAPIDMPANVVLFFFSEIIETIAGRGDATKVGELVAAHGRHPIWEIEHRNQRLGVLHPGVGAPLAAAFLEEAIALGARSIVAAGGAGALVPDLVLGHVVVVDSAVRDEGTSFHYLPPSRVVDGDPCGARNPPACGR